MRARPSGGIARALLWLVGGLVVGFGLIVLISPELMQADPGFLMRLIGVVLLAGLPGVILLVVVAIRRRRLDVIEAATETDPARTDRDRYRSTDRDRQPPTDPEPTP